MDIYNEWIGQQLRRASKPRFTRLRKIFRGIRRLIAYAPVVYNNEEWDYEYLDDLVVFKLQRMIDYHSKYNSFTRKDEYLSQMSLAKHYLEFPDSKGEGYRRQGYIEIAKNSSLWWW